nr:reverse transcriptase domain-containing protein [Tanacetum cinerariifolium]
MNTKEHDKRHRSRRSRSPRTSVFSMIRRERSRSPIRRERSRSPRQRAKEGGVFKRLGSRGKSVFARLDSYDQHSHSRVWFDDLPSESIDSYDDLKKAFLENYLQQKKYIKDPIELHNIKQRDGESTEDFVRRYKLESRDIKGRQRNNMDECMHMRKQIEEMLKTGKLSHLNKEIKKNNGKEQPKVTKKGETSGKDKALAILMVQHWERVDRQRITQSFSPNPEIFFPPLGEDEGTEGPMIIEAEIGGHCAHHKGYNQIQMEMKDEDKTIFITSQGIFCYTKMPFGLRNARATYQRLVDKTFHKQIARNLEVYVDDLVIKIRTEDEIVKDVEDTFKTLREINMKLNPKKCAFGVEEGMFLGYKVNIKGLKVGPDKVDAILSLPSPKCLKDTQKLNGKLASLNRALRGLKLNYTSMEKLVLTLVHASKLLKRYFQAHQIIVVTDQPIHQILSRPEVAGRLQKLSIELGEYVIHYRPRLSVKGHILADFIVERPEEDSPDTLMEEEGEIPEPWILFTDGSSCTDGFEPGLILTNPEGMEFTYALRFRFDATNNEAEYEPLIVGLRIAKQMGVKNLQANVDSRLVANQVNRTYVAKEADMIRYLEKLKALT